MWRRTFLHSLIGGITCLLLPGRRARTDFLYYDTSMAGSQHVEAYLNGRKIPNATLADVEQGLIRTWHGNEDRPGFSCHQTLCGEVAIRFKDEGSRRAWTTLTA